MKRHLLEILYEKLLSRLGLALLVLALLVNVGALLAVNRGVDALDRARAWAEHSRDLMTVILGVQSMMYENDSAQRGFLYTQREDYLAPLKENKDRVSAKLAALSKQVADNPAQVKLIEQVSELAKARIALQDKTIALQHMGRQDAAREIVMSDQGKVLMEEIDRTVATFLTHEEQQRRERTGKSADIQLAIRWGFAIILFINAMMILAGAVTIMRGMAREADRDRMDLVHEDQRTAAEEVRHVERAAAEVVREDQRTAAEVVRHDERTAAEEVRQDERAAAEVVREDERAATSAYEVVQRAAELRALSAHLLRVQEEERRTIARELHDELGGTLSAVKMDILMGRDAAAKRSDEKSAARLQRGLTAIDSAVQFVRRLIEDLRPTLLDNLGLEAALRSMTEQFSERTSVQCAIVLPDGELNLTSAQSTALYRVCQEALTNIMKYAKATHVSITLASDGTLWSLVLADNGVGLDATKQHRAISHGLLGMRERMVALGGTFDIRGAKGHGTTLTATFPVEAAETPDP